MLKKAGKGGIVWKDLKSAEKGRFYMEKELWHLLGLYLLAVNLTAFALMGLDKRRAKRGKWRIPEKTLFLPAVLGGALGGTVGMRAFRHKTRHWYFRYGLPLLLFLQLGALIWLTLLSKKNE